jgi:hypothetical protein
MFLNWETKTRGSLNTPGHSLQNVPGWGPLVQTARAFVASPTYSKATELVYSSSPIGGVLADTAR